MTTKLPMRSTIAVSVLLIAGCGGVGIRNVTPTMYRIAPCESKQDQLQCSRLARQQCPDGYAVLNPQFAQTNGQLIDCN